MGLSVVSRNWRCGWIPDGGYEAAMHAEEPERGWGFYVDEGPVYWEDRGDGWGWPPWVDEDYGDLIACVDPVPFYSTDMSAAWEVVEKFQSMGCMVWLTICHDGECLCDIAQPGQLPPMRGIWSQDAPLAICRAALRAVVKGNPSYL